MRDHVPLTHFITVSAEGVVEVCGHGDCGHGMCGHQMCSLMLETENLQQIPLAFIPISVCWILAVVRELRPRLGCLCAEPWLTVHRPPSVGHQAGSVSAGLLPWPLGVAWSWTASPWKTVTGASGQEGDGGWGLLGQEVEVGDSTQASAGWRRPQGSGCTGREQGPGWGLVPEGRGWSREGVR